LPQAAGIFKVMNFPASIINHTKIKSSQAGEIPNN